MNVERYPNNCPPREIAPWLELGFGSSSGLVLGFEGNQKIATEENCPPVRVRVWLRVSFGVGGTIFLGGNCPRTQGHLCQINMGII